MTHICVSKPSIIGSDNGLSPDRRQAIIWTNAGILLIRTLGTNFNEILFEIHIFSFKNIHLKMSSAKWRPFYLGLNVLTLLVLRLECSGRTLVNTMVVDALAPGIMILTHLPLDKMAASSQTIFSDAFSWMKTFIFWSKFHWSLFLTVQFTITQYWFR